jgi:heterodisulfide reductase subunit A
MAQKEKTMSEQAVTAVIICSCSGCLGDAIHWEEVTRALADHPANPRFIHDELACATDHLDTLQQALQDLHPQRVVVAACSPRDHETTFQQLLSAAGINPYLLQMVPVREQVAWVTASPAEATTKTIRLLQAALNRVLLQAPLEARTIPVCPDVVIIGGGPAGLQAARMLVRAGRRVTLIEREPFLGGIPVRLEELFPAMECGPCLLEPLLQEALHELDTTLFTHLTLAEVTALSGQFGAWTVTVRQQPRYVHPATCIGCQTCCSVCPERFPDPWTPGNQQTAIAMPFFGALPSVPSIAPTACRQLRDGSCRLCQDACPVAGTIDFDDSAQEFTLTAGALIVATGATEEQTLPPAFTDQPDICTAYGFERLLALNGPTGGHLLTAAGETPRSLAIIQCAGSLDPEEAFYCSGICCQVALKLAAVARRKQPELLITRLVREQVVPGPAASTLLLQDTSTVQRYAGLAGLRLEQERGRRILLVDGSAAIPADLIVLCRPFIPNAGSSAIARLLALQTDAAGFLAPLHGQSAPMEAARKGIYLAGSCRGPGSLQEAIIGGSAAAGLVLAELQPGRDLVIDPLVATVDETRCTGCQLCLSLCPFQAISWSAGQSVATISDLLCQGCGICAAACPAAAITANGATRAMLRAELRGILR